MKPLILDSALGTELEKRGEYLPSFKTSIWSAYSLIHNPEAIKVVPINMILRSILSDKYPIGHWESAPKELIMTINIEISNSPSSLEAAYTAPYPKTAL